MRILSIAALTACLAVSACATAASLRGKAPDLDQVVTGTPEKVAGCIGDKLEASPIMSRGTLSSRPTTNGYSISEVETLSGGTDTVILVDLTKADAGTRVELYTHFMTGNGGIPALIRGCL